MRYKVLFRIISSLLKHSATARDVLREQLSAKATCYDLTVEQLLDLLGKYDPEWVALFHEFLEPRAPK
jgi:hypothetical protein